MDIIERLVIPRPIVLCVIDFEEAVWRHPAGLYTTEIGADDHSGRKHIREIYRPDPRAGSEIQHLLGARVNGSPEKSISQEMTLHGMLHVESFSFGLVVGKCILCASWISQDTWESNEKKKNIRARP